MSRYQAYAEYKDSGVEWQKSIPANWTVLRYKHALRIMQGLAFKSVDYVDNSDVVNMRMGNIKKGGLIDLEHNVKFLPSSFKGTYQDYALKNGDAIIAMTDMSPSLDFLAVPAILEGLDGNTSYLLNQRVGKLLINDGFDIRFIRYLLLSDELRIQLKAKGLGTVQANMSNDDLYNSFFFCPTSSERTNIANFLDHETAKIDLLIEKQQSLIALLKEKRQAVISHAVTKGLNPNAPMKDAEVEWVDRIPDYWKSSRLRFFARISNGATPSRENLSFWDDGTIGWLNSSKVNDDIINFADQFITELAKSKTSVASVTHGDLVMAITGEGQTRGRVAICNLEATINQHLAAISIHNPSLLHNYLYLWLVGNYERIRYESEGAGSTKGAITCSDIGSFPIIIPPRDEQLQIIAFVDEKKRFFDQLESTAIAAITLMQERRTALISAAVTGKIDVRDWQPA